MINNSKRQPASNSDMNNNDITSPKKVKRLYSVGQIIELHMLNFMCYKNFSIHFHPTHMQIVTGANGSGKSSIANAICLCLGAQARTTGRTSNVQSFIRKGETSAELTITLANEGPEAFKPELYGKEIQIIRRIGARQSGYKILGANHKIISTRKETIDELMQALSISPENPLCVLHQDIAKTFLINSDSGKKYQFYLKVSQLDQIKQAYEQGVCTIQSLTQRVNAMKQKHNNMLRELKPLEEEVNKIEIRRDYEEKRHRLEAELIFARTDQAGQELFETQHELDLIQKTKDNTDNQIIEENNQLLAIDQRLENYLIEKNDLEKDINELRELSAHFSKEKHEIQLRIHSFKFDFEGYRQILTEIEWEQTSIQKQLDRYEILNQQSTNTGQEYLTIDHEISTRQDQQREWERILSSSTDDIHLNDENIREKQLTIEFLENELRQKQQDLEQLTQIDRDKTNVYAPWMSDCLKTIQNDQRFDKKPIGPISRYIHCINSHWSYAVEKHLAPIMSSFICHNNDDEKILIEILSSYSPDHRPPIYVRAYSNHVHDISGTNQYIKQANLLTIYDVLKIDNVTVECALIDFKQIEVTILVENFEEAKRLRASGVLCWKKLDRKVRQVSEAWTCDGSNIKLDNTLRIYTNDKQAIRYFLSNSNQALSIEELEVDIKSSSEQIKQMNESLNNLKTVRQTTMEEMNQTKKANANNKRKLRDLMKEHDRLNATMPVILDCSLEELQANMRKFQDIYTNTTQQYNEAKEQQEKTLRQLTDMTENQENITRKLDGKTQQYDSLIEKLHDEQSKRYENLPRMKNFTKKSAQLNEDIRKYHEKISQLTKKLSKKSKRTTAHIRSVRDIQHELDAIDNYLQANEDTNEVRREIINSYRLKRDAARQYKQTYERCYQQIDHLKEFIGKRQEGFLTIADQHQYFLRFKFQNLMKKYQFDDSDIKIDHKKEELHIIIKRDQSNLVSLSGGERSISTFCFLSALWESIYQPFRLLDEIDIYMDNEKLNSTLNILYENTFHYSSSQHIIFTPQTIDSQSWNEFDVPVFQMPTPKRSF